MKGGGYRENGIDKSGCAGQNPSNRIQTLPMTALCKHPIVKIVAREDDIEFVECQKCGEVFDSAEYNDMALEEAEELEDASMDD
jgi:hypothetical protein